MATAVPAPSARRQELLERAYRYVLEHGLADMSLRPMAAAVGSSPRVLLFLFGSKDELVRALLARARADELALLARLRGRAGAGRAGGSLGETAAAVWGWLIAAEHRSLLRVWVESYAKSVTEPAGPWAGFARSTVDDWLSLLAEAQPHHVRYTSSGEAQRTLVLAVLRGGLLDVLATGEAARPTRAVKSFLRTL
jgi:AcrR family transcriptional regulator